MQVNAQKRSQRIPVGVQRGLAMMCFEVNDLPIEGDSDQTFSTSQRTTALGRNEFGSSL